MAVLGWVVATPLARAVPAEIIILRHAEKPATGSELNERGWERARALPDSFLRDARLLEHGRAVAIYVGAPAKAGGSVRSIQTMQPTAQALQLKLHEEITRDEIDRLAKAILTDPAYNGKTVVVCWEHKKIPGMLKALGCTTGPDFWADEVYDRFWVLDFADGRAVQLRDLPQRLLPGDSAR